jgi:hypothetical protein
MNHWMCMWNRDVRRALLTAALAPALALLAGCAAEGEASEPNAGDSRRSPDQELVGGEPARADEFPSTVGIGGDCSAAKVGDRRFLTAAHCVAVPRPWRVPVENFPPNGGVQERYLPGQPLSMHWGRDASDPNDEARGTFTVVKTSIHATWWRCAACAAPHRHDEGAADIAVIEIAEATPQIPKARVELDTIALDAHVIKGGYGCEDRIVPGRDGTIGRYKRADAWIIPVSEIRRFDTLITDAETATIDASYLITAGHAQDEKYASLCPGDSGGPLYLPDTSDPRVVGVNSDYTFPIPGPDDPGGVSWTDWHTRTSLDSLHGVGQWLIDLGVDTVAGAEQGG